MLFCHISSYAQFTLQLLHEHYQSGSFCKHLKASLYTSPHKGSRRNFGLDTQREMDHKDVSRSLKSGGTVESAIPKMADVDFLIQELQMIVKEQQNEYNKIEGHSEVDVSLSSVLGLEISPTDREYIYIEVLFLKILNSIL